LSFLSETQKISWIEALQMVDQSDKFGIPELMVLLSPKRWYEELHLNISTNDPRGNATFKANPEVARCHSEIFWGYDCPITNTKTHIDHIFPWSRGGMTHSSNSIYLCELHNSLKSSDIHVYPWEKSLGAIWIKLSFDKLISAASRLTNEKLYYPKNQASRI
jgi:hypothetical protein